MNGHRRPLTVHGILAWFVEVDVGKKIGLLADLQPIVIRKKKLDLVVVAVVENGQVSRLVIETDCRNGQSLGMGNIDGRLHLSRIAKASPMAGILGTGRVGELRLALLARRVGYVHVMRAPTVLVLLPGLHFVLLSGLTSLASGSDGLKRKRHAQG